MQDLVTVFGGSGFLGSQVVRALAKAGHRVRVAVRQPHLAGKMRLLGDVGQVEIVQANVRNRASIDRALSGVRAGVNLVGILYETGRQKFQAVHTTGAQLIAASALAQGVEHMVQMSALGADLDSPSEYARSKAMGEAAVREVFPGAVILRPSIIFGPGDNFFNRFAEMAVLSPVLPLIGGGHTRFQPVFVGDVAQAVQAVLTAPASAGLTYELAGPATYSFKALMDLVVAETGRKRALLPLPFAVARMIGAVSEILALTPIAPPLTRDQVELLRTDNVVSGAAPGLDDLGIAATAVEAILPAYLYRFRKGGQYADETERLVAV